MKKKYLTQLFANEFDDGQYCDFSATAAKAVAGKDILLGVWNADGTTLLAISGQKGLTINRSADTVEVTSKDTAGGWKAYIQGMKEWSIDMDGLFVRDDESHSIMFAAFTSGDPVCLKVYNNKTHEGMFGGLAVITDYPIEAPYDDSVTFNVTFTGIGELVNLSDGTLGSLTVSSSAGTATGDTKITVTPALVSGNSYKYKVADAKTSVTYDQNVQTWTVWDGTSDITAETGKVITVVECDGSYKAKKAGHATVTAKA